MKDFVLITLAIAVMFSSCKKEEEALNSADPFSCKIDGVEFSTTAINIESLSDNMKIIASNATYIVSISIESITARSVGDVIPFSASNFGNVTIGSTTYSNTYFDPSKGEIAITTLDLSGGKISGTFFFEAQNVAPNEFGTVNVTVGTFSNISF